MSNSNRVQRFAAIAFSIALMASVLGLLGDFVSRHWQRVHEANATYQKNAEYDRDKSADEIAQTCGDLTALQFRECVRNNLEAHYNDQATNEDLQAQQEWTRMSNNLEQELHQQGEVARAQCSA